MNNVDAITTDDDEIRMIPKSKPIRPMTNEDFGHDSGFHGALSSESPIPYDSSSGE